MISQEKIYVSSERENVINQIADKLTSPDFSEAWSGESVGGNAGENKVAVIAWVDKKTGKIIKFGVWREINKEIRGNPDLGEVIFLYDVGLLSLQRDKFKPGHFVDVLNEGAVSEEAMADLKAAINKANKIILQKRGP